MLAVAKKDRSIERFFFDRNRIGQKVPKIVPWDLMVSIKLRQADAIYTSEQEPSKYSWHASRLLFMVKFDRLGIFIMRIIAYEKIEVNNPA